MASRSKPAAPAAPRSRGRRGGRLLLLVILLVLIGRGLGLAGNETKPTGGAEQQAPPPADVGAAPQADAGTPPAPLTEASRPGTGPAGFDSDRFASLRSLVECNTRNGDLGAALATLHHVRSLPLDGAQRAALLPSAEALETALAQACTGIVECLAKGRALAARDAVQALFRDGRSLAEPYVDSALRAAGLPGGLLRPLAATDRVLPVARPLARGRDVRIVEPHRTSTGAVADARSDQLTVRVQTANGWAFPTVCALACEPVQPSADEATEMGLLAVQEHDALLARLWLAVARLRSPHGLPARGEVLAGLLP
jgi:hypothetical protein